MIGSPSILLFDPFAGCLHRLHAARQPLPSSRRGSATPPERAAQLLPTARRAFAEWRACDGARGRSGEAQDAWRRCCFVCPRAVADMRWGGRLSVRRLGWSSVLLLGVPLVMVLA